MPFVRPRRRPSAGRARGRAGRARRRAPSGPRRLGARLLPTSRRRPPLPSRTAIEPRRWSRSCSVSASASWTRSPARHNTTSIARKRQPWRSSLAWRITATISSTVADRPDSASPCCAAGARRGSRASSPATGGARPRPDLTRRTSNLVPTDSRYTRRRTRPTKPGLPLSVTNRASDRRPDPCRDRGVSSTAAASARPRRRVRFAHCDSGWRERWRSSDCGAGALSSTHPRR
jgi:hypothetical protein